MSASTMELKGIESKPLTKACEDYLDQKENVRDATQRENAKLDKIGERVSDLMKKDGKKKIRVTNERGGAHCFEIIESEDYLKVSKEKKIRNSD